MDSRRRRVICCKIFTKHVQDQCTLFYEIIERRGARGFGENNITALARAAERETDAAPDVRW